MKRKSDRIGLQMRSLRKMGTLLCILGLPCCVWGQQERDTITRRKLDEVIVHERKQAGKERVKRESLMRVPSLLGEYDLVKYLATLPGVFSVNALDPGIYVRGGSSAENAFWVNDMEVANPNHLTGIISMFDSYVLGNSLFYKSGFPPRYNNYLSSYINMIPTKGNRKNYHGEASVGLLSSSLKLQGPLIRDNTSFVASGRTSYLQHVAKIYNQANDSESMPEYGFSDVTLGITSNLNARWHLSLFGLYTSDRLLIDLSNNSINHRLEWNTFSTNVKVDHVGETGDFSFGGGLTDSHANGKSKGYVDVEANNHYRTLELFARYNKLLCNGLYGEVGGRFQGLFFNISSQKAMECSIYQGYANLKYEIGEHWTFDMGMNYQFYQGNADAGTWSPRLKANYNVNGWNIWVDYAKSVQYETLYPYFTLRSPIDMRYPLQRGDIPAACHHVSWGVDRKVGESLYLYMAFFYKKMLHVKDFLSGVKIFQEEISDLMVEGTGQAKGIETDFIFEKGFFYSRMNYTLSESTRKFDKINEGKRFHSPFDMKHRLLLNVSFRIVQGLKVNAMWTYSSGGYATFPVSVAFAQDITSVKGESKFIPIYQDRYNFRLPNNHRLDLSADYERQRGNYLFSWSAGVYNLYNQQNPTFVYFEPRVKDKYYTQFVPYSKVLLPFIPYISFTLKW